MQINYSEFSGAKVAEFKNAVGLCVKLCALGAGIMSVTVPDKDGVSREVTRLDDKGYAAAYHGQTIGRTSGRIENATFEIDGQTAVLEKNNHGMDNLHGGHTGFHSKVFALEVADFGEYNDAVFTYTSPDGEGGYFGNVDVRITYRIYEKSQKFEILFEGAPDRKTLLNLTNHLYWNMSGDLRKPVTQQKVFLNASRYGVLDERLIVREIAQVTPQFDFRTPRLMGEYITDETVQRHTLGYDHPFFLDGRGTDKLACSLYSDLSGIKLEVRTTYPCVVVFGDNFGGYNSVCFECQYHPDGIHACPDDCGICSPDSPYSEKTVYEFKIA